MPAFLARTDMSLRYRMSETMSITSGCSDLYEWK